MQWGIKKSRFSTNIWLYLGNNARENHSYYERRIGNRTQAFEVTSNTDFTVTIIQRQITQKWYNIKLHTMADQ